MKLTEKLSAFYNSPLGKIIHVGVVTAAAYPTMHQLLKGNPSYNLGGFLSCFVGVALDQLSTIPLVKLTNTEKFKKSNLSERYYEQSPLLGKHPSIREYAIKSAIKDSLMITWSYLFPPIGLAYLTLAPIIFLDNRRIKKSLEKELKAFEI